MYEAESFAPLGLSLRRRRPTAGAVGCILAPLRGFVRSVIPHHAQKKAHQRGPSHFFNIDGFISESVDS